MSNADEKLLPKAAEAAVVGSMLIDSACIETVLGIISDQDFAFPENKILFQTILNLRSEKKGIDAVILRNELENRGQLENIGGIDYITKVLDSVPSSANAEYYAKIVLEKSKLRKLVNVGEQIRKVIESADSAGEGVFQIQQLADGLNGAIEPSGNSRAVCVSLGDVQSLPINWLWYNRIPQGMLTLLIGDPGLGKSFLCLYLAAKISTGGVWPDGDRLPDNSAPQGSIIILSAEDDLPRVIRPRLDSLGADVTKIISLEGVRIRDENDREYLGYFNLERDLGALHEAIRRQKDTKLIILDPLSAFLGRDVDSHRDSDVRGILAPLVALAEENQVAVIGVMHLNKNSSGSKVVYRAMGSLAFTAASRTVWLVSTDPNDPESKRRLLTPAKHNILIDPTGLAFELNSGKVVFENEPVNITADEAISTIEAPERDRAKQWLSELLPPGTSIAATEIQKQAEAEGISIRTLNRAKRELKVVSYPLQTEAKRPQWFWRIE